MNLSNLIFEEESEWCSKDDLGVELSVRHPKEEYPIGCLSFYVKKNKLIEIFLIEVEEKYRRKGIAKKLFEKLKMKYPNLKINYGKAISKEGQYLINSLNKI